MIAGGGTGGHIFPAIAIANAIKKALPETTLLFVGAKGKMEMQKIPEAGFPIEGIDIAGFNRSSLIQNIALPFKLVQSFWQVHSIIQSFRPDAVIGVGGYSSFPVLRYAQWKRIPTFLHESNSFAGKSNQLLAKHAVRIFVGADGMETFFPSDKLEYTGNPVRSELSHAAVNQEEGRLFFGLEPNKKTLLVTGGSLGAKGINEAVAHHLQLLKEQDIQLIWQTGYSYESRAKAMCTGNKNWWSGPFIRSMVHAYAAADLVISRSGAMTIAELCVMGKPALFVPFPHAAEDHQTVNASEMVKKGAARMVKDKEAMQRLIPAAIDLLRDADQLREMSLAMKKSAITDADQKIAESIISYFEN